MSMEITGERPSIGTTKVSNGVTLLLSMSEFIFYNSFVFGEISQQVSTSPETVWLTVLCLQWLWMVCKDLKVNHSQSFEWLVRFVWCLGYEPTSSLISYHVEEFAWFPLLHSFVWFVRSRLIHSVESSFWNQVDKESNRLWAFDLAFVVESLCWLRRGFQAFKGWIDNQSFTKSVRLHNLESLSSKIEPFEMSVRPTRAFESLQ